MGKEQEMKVGYKVFNTEKELLNWQEEKERKIFTVSPFIENLQGKTDNSDMNVNTSVGIVVTYEVVEYE